MKRAITLNVQAVLCTEEGKKRSKTSWKVALTTLMHIRDEPRKMTAMT